MDNITFNELIKSFKTRPDDFRITKYTLVDSKTGVEFWISGSVWFYEVFQPKIKFTTIQKFRFAWAARKVLENYDRIVKDLEKREQYYRKKELESIFVNKGE